MQDMTQSKVDGVGKCPSKLAALNNIEIAHKADRERVESKYNTELSFF